MSSGIMMSSMQYICSVYVMFRLHDVRYVMRVLLSLCQICHMSSGIMVSSMQYICSVYVMFRWHDVMSVIHDLLLNVSYIARVLSP